MFLDAGSIPAASTKLKNDGPERGRCLFPKCTAVLRCPSQFAGIYSEWR